jgi:hypothetical protein
MKLLKILFCVLMVMGMASVSLAQPALAQIRFTNVGADSVNHHLRAPCDLATGVPFPDGTVIAIFWDNNANGPDTSDHQPTVGTGYAQVSFNSSTFNGTARGYGAGFFNFSSNLRIQQPARQSQGDTSLYYLQVNSGGTCWHSHSFLLRSGTTTVALRDSNWTCLNLSCGASGEPPHAPTNCVATDDAGCLAVTVTWQHDSLNVAGFNVYRNDTTHLAGAFTRLIRTANLAVDTDVPENFFVRAFNSLGAQSPSSNTDEGRTYLLRFVNGTSGDVRGTHAAGSAVTLFMERPTATCPSGYKIYLLQGAHRSGPWTRYAENGGHALAQDSLTTQITFHLPVDTVCFCRILLVDSSFDRGVKLYDTTSSVFYLGISDTNTCYSDVPDISRVLPDHYALLQNYPNPFNPETEIAFMVPMTAQVRIKVYNVLGQEVRTLANDVYTTGIHHLRWDGRSNGGVQLGAGVYFYRMEAPGYAQTMKMLMLK